MDASCPRVKVKRNNQRPSSEEGHKSRNLFAKLASCKKRCEREEEIEAGLGVKRKYDNPTDLWII
jgi:hypothetical protein